MRKKLKDYLPMYMGCDIMFEQSWYTLVGIITNLPAEEEQEYNVRLYNDHLGHEYSSYKDVKPMLRPLSDMTEQESDYILPEAMEGKPTIIVNAAMTAWLLSKHFDLFGLIDAGLAIDKT